MNRIISYKASITILLLLPLCAFSQNLPKLIAQSRWKRNMAKTAYMPYDSIAFSHDISRNSIPSEDWLNINYNTNYAFDTAFSYSISTTPAVFDLETRAEYAGNMLTSYIIGRYDATGSFFTFTKELYTNKNGKRDSAMFFDYTTKDTIIINKYEYYSNGLPNNITFYQYDSSLQTWKPYRKYEYTYNNSGSEISLIILEGFPSPLYQRSKKLSYYNVSGQRIIDSIYSWNRIDTIIHHFYTSNGLMSLDSIHVISGFDEKYLYRYDANQNIVEKIKQYLNPITSQFEKYGRVLYTYNSYSQLTSVEEQDWDYNSGSWSLGHDYIRYYYGDPLTINSKQHNNTRLSLFPIPATTYINLDMKLDKPENLSVTILNMQGQLVKLFREQASGDYHKNILVQDLPAGQYMMQVKDSKELKTANFTVIH